MSGEASLIAKGIGASPGSAEGQIALDEAEARRARDAGLPYILVAHALSREDAEAARAAAAIVVTTGGITADAAVMARALSKPCVVSAPLRLFGSAASTEDGKTIAPGALLRVDGGSGEVFVISAR